MRVYWHEEGLAHDTGAGMFDQPGTALIEVPELHPENPERIRNIRSALRHGPIAPRLEWHTGRHATPDELALVHPAAYVESVRAACAAGPVLITQSTPVGPASFGAALASAGTALAATEAVLSGASPLAYALVRPPGHHAQPAQADGYCLFSNSALCAELARRRGIERVAVVDWDVHHGNGTQACFWDRGDVVTVSLHMNHGSWGPHHPQTGAPDELGEGDGRGRNVNVALPLGTGDEGYRRAWEQVVEPVLDGFRPGLLVIACGQDASQYDPNGRMSVTMAGFRDLGAAARQLADRHCDGRMVLVQEGGYGRTYSAFCMHATLEGVLGTGRLLDDPLAYLPDDGNRADAAIAAVRGALAPHWHGIGG
jgi:acetoin utilization deacetylase AcuC-like enzyme